MDEERIKGKLKKLVDGMLESMTVNDCISCAETCINALAKLPDSQKEGLIDMCLNAKVED